MRSVKSGYRTEFIFSPSVIVASATRVVMSIVMELKMNNNSHFSEENGKFS